MKLKNKNDYLKFKIKSSSFDMTEISCFFSSHSRRPSNFTFIKYQQFMKISLCDKSIIIRIENLKRNQTLFEFYILSLLCTEDPKLIRSSNALNGAKIFGVSTERLRNRFIFTGEYDFIMLEKRSFKNPLLSQEPKRETSIRKINKFLDMMDDVYDMRINPFHTISLYKNQLILDTDIIRIIEYEKRINVLCCIRGFNRDIYLTIKKFL